MIVEGKGVVAPSPELVRLSRDECRMLCNEAKRDLPPPTERRRLTGYDGRPYRPRARQPSPVSKIPRPGVWRSRLLLFRLGRCLVARSKCVQAVTLSVRFPVDVHHALSGLAIE